MKMLSIRNNNAKKTAVEPSETIDYNLWLIAYVPLLMMKKPIENIRLR